MTQPDQITCRNLLLKAMSAGDFELISPLLTRVTLVRNQVLAPANTPIKLVYFMEEGIASIVSTAATSGATEVGIFGREGLSGVSVLLGAETSPHETFIQVDGGPALSIGSSQLLEVVNQSFSLRSVLLRYVQTFLVQTSSSIVASSHHRIESRLARWILMCHDRIDGDNVRLTHEFLSMMIGAQRTGVTMALHVLEGEGMIRSKRGLVIVLNRKKLEVLAGESYGRPEAEYRKLILPFGQSFNE